MRSYECMVIVDPNVSEEQLTDIVQRLSDVVTNAGGTIQKADNWGKRRLAYPIDGKGEGQYVLFQFQADHAATQELEHVMKITDGVVRYLLLRREEN